MPPLIKGDEMTNDNELHSEISCKECQMGRLTRRYVTYITWLGDEMITVPDFPAWICDVCGARIYDGHALNRLSLLLSPNAGRPTLKPAGFIASSLSNKARPSQPS